MKKIISRFAVTVTIIISVGLIVTGGIAASIYTEKISEGKTYSIFVFNNDSQKVEFGSDKKTFKFDKAILRELEKFSDLIYLTPFGAFYGLYKILR